MFSITNWLSHPTIHMDTITWSLRTVGPTAGFLAATLVEQSLKLGAIKLLLLHKRIGQGGKLVHTLGEYCACHIVTFVENMLHFGIDDGVHHEAAGTRLRG